MYELDRMKSQTEVFCCCFCHNEDTNPAMFFFKSFYLYSLRETHKTFCLFLLIDSKTLQVLTHYSIEPMAGHVTKGLSEESDKERERRTKVKKNVISGKRNKIRRKREH